jgi:polysaccharide biosynthesis transport protein
MLLTTDMTNDSGTDQDITAEESPLQLLSLARMLWKHKWLAGLIWSIGAAVSLIVVRLLPSVYRAQAVILVDSQKIPETFVSSTVRGDIADRLALITQTIMTSARLTDIINTFHLYRNNRQHWTEQELISRMRQDISVSFEKSWTGDQMHAFRLSYQGDSATIVAEVTNRLAGLYVAENSRVREHQADDTVEFLGRQLRAAKTSLDQQEQKVAQFKQRHAGVLPEQQNSLLGTLSSLGVELQAKQADLDRAQETKLSLAVALSAAESSEATLAADLAKGSTGSEGVPFRGRSDILKEQLRSLRARYTPRYPDIKELERQLAQAEADEAEEIPGVESAASGASDRFKSGHSPDPISVVTPPQLVQARERVRNIRAQLDIAGRKIQSIEEERKQLLAAIADCKARIDKLPLVEQEMADLKRNYEESANNYNSLLQKQLAAGVATDMEHSQKSERFTVVEPARPPEKPEKPKRPLLAGVGIVLSLVIALLATFALEGRNRTVLGEWELPPGTVVLGRVPVIDMAASGIRSDHV